MFVLAHPQVYRTGRMNAYLNRYTPNPNSNRTPVVLTQPRTLTLIPNPNPTPNPNPCPYPNRPKLGKKWGAGFSTRALTQVRADTYTASYTIYT